MYFSYLFWTDWAVSEAKVARSNLDGSDVRTLIGNGSVEWPNGLSVDYMAERLYWVDARHDYIASCDLHGKNIKKVIKNDVSIDFNSKKINIMLYILLGKSISPICCGSS